ncbi:MAG: DUF2804 domain-containing protein [Desulfobacula sp.]|nr:DUF2804 domain-containing protein [Desulfobacula sp.]
MPASNVEHPIPCGSWSGSWSGPFGHTDTSDLLNLDTAPFSVLGLNQRLKEKRWCYMGIFHPDIIFGCAVIHLGYMASAFAFGFDRQKRRMTEFSFVFPPLGQARYDRNPELGICSYRSLFGKITLAHNYPSGKGRIDTDLSFLKKSLQTDIDVTMPDCGLSFMNFLMPMVNGKKAFTSKAAGLCAKGQIVLNKHKYDLTPSDTFVVFDWTNGFYPRKTFWNWACGAGKDNNGTRIGFNFSQGVYEYGLLENTVWINGSPHETGPVDFIYDKKNPDQTWQILTLDGRIQLFFKPEGLRFANDNLGIIKSRFIQPCGTFEGLIQIKDETPIQFSNMGGVVEEHFAKW